jgi:hypothetical protein
MTPIIDLLKGILTGPLSGLVGTVLHTLEAGIDDAEAKVGAGKVTREWQKAIMAVCDPKTGAPLDARCNLARGLGDRLLEHVGGISSPFGAKVDAFVQAVIEREKGRGTANEAATLAARTAADHAMDEALLDVLRAVGAKV